MRSCICARYVGSVFAHKDVHLGPDAEAGQVDAGLDREAGPRDEAPLVVRFEVVHVGAGAVHLGADRVAGAVKEVLAEAPLADRTAGRVVHLEAAQQAAGAYALLDKLHGAVARLGHDLENVGDFRRRLRAAETRPRDVVVDARRASPLWPTCRSAASRRGESRAMRRLAVRSAGWRSSRSRRRSARGPLRGRRPRSARG